MAPSPPPVRPTFRLLTPTKRRDPPTRSLLRTLTPTKFRVAPVEDVEGEGEEERVGEAEEEDRLKEGGDGVVNAVAEAEPQEVDGAVGGDAKPHQERPETTGLSRPGSNAGRRSATGSAVRGDEAAEADEAGATGDEIENRDIYYENESFEVRAESGNGSVSPGGSARLRSGNGSARIGSSGGIRIGSARGSRSSSRPVSASLPPIETPVAEMLEARWEKEEEEQNRTPSALKKLSIPEINNEAKYTGEDSPPADSGIDSCVAAPTSPSSLPPSLPSPQDHRTTPEGDSHADDEETQQQQLLLQQQQQQQPESEKMALSNGFVPDGQIAVTA